MREIHFSQVVDPKDDYALIVSPDAEFDLTVMSPRDRWKFEDQKRRLERRGIKLADVSGQIGEVR